jgi:hypothetical protein
MSIQALLALIFLLVLAASMFGWGNLCRRATGVQFSVTQTVALGMAVWIFLGGVLNMASLARPLVLDAIVLAGLLFTYRHLRSRREVVPTEFPMHGDKLTTLSAGLVLVIAVLMFRVATQLPPQALNFHDDLEKYLPHVVRVLGTGSIAGSPLNGAGYESLGGQTFLQGFMAAHFQLHFINGFDALFCLLLCMLMTLEEGWRRGQGFAAVGAAFLFFWISPQYVNVSALYSGAALIVLLATAAPVAAQGLQRKGRVLARQAVPGLVYAGLIALKPTFAVFAAGHFSLAALARVGSRRNGESAAGLSFAPLAWTALFLSPWLMLHAPLYLDAVTAAGNGPWVAYDLSGIPGFGATLIRLVSIEETYYGGSYLAFSAAAFAALTLGVLHLRYGCSSQSEEAARSCNTGCVGVASAACYLLFAVALAGSLSEDAGLRYVAPILIGGVPPVFLLPSGARGDGSLRRLSRAGVFAAGVAIALLFLPSTVLRMRNAAESGSILGFSALASSDDYRWYIQFVLGDRWRQRVRHIQAMVPENQPLIAWINTPFHLDFERNPIFDLNAAGLAAPWARLPDAATHILWEKPSFAFRSVDEYARNASVSIGRRRAVYVAAQEAWNRIKELEHFGSTVYADERFLLFEVPAALPPIGQRTSEPGHAGEHR